jgi:hypothetical protein
MSLSDIILKEEIKMKKLALVFAAVLFIGIWPLAGAQMMHNYMMNQDTTGNYGMGRGSMMGHGYMGQGMRYGMMNRGNMGNMYNMMNGMSLYHGNMMMMQMPMMPYFMIVNTIAGMQDQLSLTNEQSDKLIQLQSDFLKREIDAKADLNRNVRKLKSLLKEKTSSDVVKKQLELCESSGIIIQSDVYDTAMKMRNVLNKDQQQKFDNLISQYMSMYNGMMSYSTN